MSRKNWYENNDNGLEKKEQLFLQKTRYEI